MTKLLLVDCDGTIREPLSGAKFISHPRDQRIMAGADKAIAHYRSRGWDVLGITNQGGVAAGHKSLEDAIAEQEYTLELFPELSMIYFCPDFEGQECWMISSNAAIDIHNHQQLCVLAGTFRKPKPGMLVAAMRWWRGMKSDVSAGTWYIGDREEDVGAAAAAGVNYLDAAIWRSRFLPGMHEMPPLTPAQIEFLEGVKL